jgi:hypothetical protein
VPVMKVLGLVKENSKHFILYFLDVSTIIYGILDVSTIIYGIYNLADLTSKAGFKFYE